MNDTLASAFARESVLLQRTAADWREAIALAGGGLVAAGATTAEYTQAMIDVVDANGPYIVIAPGFALAHARPSEAVLRWGMSIVTLAEPVVFGAGENDPVHVVLGLAAVDKQQHIEALQLLAQKLVLPEFVNSLLKLSSFEQFLEILSN